LNPHATEPVAHTPERCSTVKNVVNNSANAWNRDATKAYT
jgi:hypothetical protein